MVGKCGEELEVGHKIWAQVYLCPAVATFSNQPTHWPFQLGFSFVFMAWRIAEASTAVSFSFFSSLDICPNASANVN